MPYDPELFQRSVFLILLQALGEQGALEPLTQKEFFDLVGWYLESCPTSVRVNMRLGYGRSMVHESVVMRSLKEARDDGFVQLHGFHDCERTIKVPPEALERLRDTPHHQGSMSDTTRAGFLANARRAVLMWKNKPLGERCADL